MPSPSSMPAIASLSASVKSTPLVCAPSRSVVPNREGRSRAMAERLYLFDTTLRDGAQTNGVDFTLADKLAIAGMLDELGIDYVEGGYPGANPTDTELFGSDRKFNTTFT